jgi:hypothetical protein
VEAIHARVEVFSVKQLFCIVFSPSRMTFGFDSTDQKATASMIRVLTLPEHLYYY